MTQHKALSTNLTKYVSKSLIDLVIMNKANFKFSFFNKLLLKVTLFGLLLLMFISASAQQYNVSGSAVVMTNPNCYRLTNTTGQGGAVWNIYMINLTQPFDITLTLNFGSNPGTSAVGTNCGADGMSFILQPLNTGVVGVGGLVGFGGITPSLGVIMDDFWGNATDPPYHHISINKNGDVAHGGANEIQAYTTATLFPANITDGQDHLFRFRWTPTVSGVGTIQVYFGNATTLPGTPTISYTGNIVANIFGGNPNVYWGVGGSTGACWNNQTVCMTTASNFSSPTSACVGQPVNFTDNSISGLPITVYSWDFGDASTPSTLQSPTHTFTTAGTYNVNLAIFNTGGFYSTMTHSIVINPKPNVVVNNPSICIGDSATLTATGANSYTWNNGLTPGAVKKVSPSTTTSYIVTGTNTFGCTNKDTALVTVNPNPTITATSDIICIGDTATLTASGGTTYKWVPTNSTANPLKVSPAISTTYKVIGTNSFGCKDSTNTQVIVNALPIINVVNDTICIGQTASITASGATTYVWGNNFSTTNPLNVSPNATTTYTVVGTDANGCKGQDSGKVVVNLPPVISVDSAEICIGTTAKLTASGGTNLTYLWTTNNTTFNPMFVTPSASTIYTVIATDANGCKDTASGFVNVHQKPLPSFVPSSILVNSDRPDVSFTDMSTNAVLWDWDFGDIESPDNTSALQSPTHTFSGTGDYMVWLVVTSDFGCMDSISRLIKVQTPISFYIPNAFDPLSTSADINAFKPKGTGVDLQRYEMIIFDRWGKEIFKTKDFEEGWNGKYNNAGEYLPHGVYVYYIKYKELHGIYRERTGSVTLIR